MSKHTWIVIGILVGVIAGGLAYRHFAQDVDSRGATRLMRAIEENDTEKVEKLIRSEDINVRDKSGQTALFYAARHATEPKTIYRLLVAGADPLLADKNGHTALVVAAEYNSSVPVVMALAKQGFRQPQKHPQNMSEALARAAKHNTADVIKALLIANARPVSGLNGQTMAEVFAENEKLSEQEKNDYRQVLLVLEILDGREKFLKQHPALASEKTDNQKTKEAKKQTSPVVKKVPQEKQMAPLPEVSNAPRVEKAAVPVTPKAEVPAANKAETTVLVTPEPSTPTPPEKQMDEKK